MFMFLQENDFVQFMSDPENAINVTPPPSKDEWVLDSPAVLQLNDNNFKNTVSSNQPILVMFYAPCKWLLFRSY